MLSGICLQTCYVQWTLQGSSIDEGGNTELELFSFSCVGSLGITGLKIMQRYYLLLKSASSSE